MRLEVRSMRKARLFPLRASRKVMTRRDVQQVMANRSARSPKARGSATALTMAMSMSSMTMNLCLPVEASRMLDCTVTSTHCQ